MKRVKLIIHQPQINKLIGRELNLLLNDNGNIINAITEIDKIVRAKGNFPVQDYGSLLHMVYHPVENKFYKQVAITAYDPFGKMFNVRDNPKKELPEEVTVILIPAGGCISNWEQPLNYNEFLKKIQTKIID